MDVFLQIKVILLYGAILLSIYTIFLLILGPLKFIGKLSLKFIFGGASLFLLNQGLHLLDVQFSLGINLITSFISGYLGVFGILAMALIKYLVIL